MPFDTDIIWAGTEIGLFVSNDKGESWSYSANGLPAVAIWDMKIVDDQVVVGTHGRGIWTVTLPELSNYEQPDVTLAPRLNSSVQFGDELTLNASLRSVYDSTHVMLGNSVQATVFNDAIVDSTIKVLPTVGGSQKVYLKSYVDGRAYLSAPIQTDVTVDVEDESTMPQKYALSQNYPNPFNPTTTISYSIPERSSVELKIYNSIGEEIAALVNTVKEPGKYTVKWNASGLASGIYFYKITAGEFAESKKMVLLR
jgi:hypothetical protein